MYNVFIYICIHIYVCTYIHTYIHMYLSIYTYIHIYLLIYIQLYQTHCAKSRSDGTAKSKNSSIDDSATHLCIDQGSVWEHGDEEN